MCCSTHRFFHATIRIIKDEEHFSRRQNKEISNIQKTPWNQLWKMELPSNSYGHLDPRRKRKISKFTFPALLIAIVREVFPGTKIKDIEGRIADWLRRGGDRIKAAITAANKRQLRQENEE